MIVSEVPIARRIENASAIASVGTIRKPPPTPKKPVSAPTSRPAARSDASRSGGQAERLASAAGALASLPGFAPRRGCGDEHDHREAAISAPPLTAFPSAVPAITPGSAAAVNATAWRQQTRPSRAWLRPPVERAGGDDDQRCGGRLVDALAEDVDEDGHGQHGAAATEHSEAEADAEAEGDRREGHPASALAARWSGCSIGQPCSRQVPTPPSTTWMTRAAPGRASSEAATALRCPEEQIDGDRLARGRCPSGMPSRSW